MIPLLVEESYENKGDLYKKLKNNKLFSLWLSENWLIFQKNISKLSKNFEIGCDEHGKTASR